MPSPIQLQMSVFKYLLAQKLKGVERYPLVMMLEPLFACNLECAGCGKIQYPTDILRKRLSPEEVFESAEECGAPIVSIAGGEPLIHAEIQEIVEGLIARGKFIYFCTNGILLEKHLHKFKPSPNLIFSIHLDGVEKTHDRMVCREGVYKTAVSVIKLAKSRGFQVMTNSTIFSGENPAEFRAFFDEVMALGCDGMMISPGYAYEKAPQQDIFLKNEQTKAWFNEVLKDWRRMGWDFNHSPFYMDFLQGKRQYDCTPWGNPLRNVFGWQRPCYLMSDAGYAATYRELLETTDWSRYGHASGNPKCANCMTHCGFEPTSVTDGFSSWSKFLELVRDYATIHGPLKARRAYPRDGRPYEALEKESAGRA
ncbi:MAG: adenosyl-hopene transferase HpnH [Elusimicrobia bacterium]|nr:adenosyl-hopene transferase HpnH [Elusimicrobiota bacterium]MDE2237661.1 adenosyl-hopene transferase HpnH [Elusimicrobiota bacterium]MDE2424930.1 adenosyl-hopene transferase HpnH [Elusimicrobiota bacterium]